MIINRKSPSPHRLSCLAGGLALTFTVFLAACGEKAPDRKKTYPVTGQIVVDGKPADNLAVQCHDVKGLDKEHPTMSSCFTDAEGNFKISTYESGDGVPVGDYVLTFVWGEMNMFSMTYGGPDKLKDRYKDPEKSTHKFTVKEGVPTDLGKIELTTKQ